MTEAKALEILLLGGFELRAGSDVLDSIPTRKARCLLAYLALNGDERQPREKLIGLLWGESEERNAQQSLRQALTYIRKCFDDLDVQPLVADRDSVSLDSRSFGLDVDQFRELAASNESADLEAALALYKGEMLDGLDLKDDAFQAWVDVERRTLNDLYLRTLLTLAELCSQSGDHEKAIGLAQRLLAIDPLQERVHRMLMTLYAQTGRREAALRQFTQCRDVLSNELDVEPEAATIELFETLRRDGGAERPVTAPSPTEDLSTATPAAYEPSLRSRGRFWGRWHWVGLAAASICLAAFVGWTWVANHKHEPASLDRMAFPLPDAPSIAVLPFDNLSGDPDQDYFADGLTDDLITDISKIPGVFVIARNSTFYYRNQDVPIRQVAEELGVRYVMEGSVRRSGDSVRINMQLIDATTGGHVWAERYDITMAEVFELQDDVTKQVANTLELRLGDMPTSAAWVQETDDPEAYDAVLRALEHIRNYTREDLAIAHSFLEKALQRDPEYARAHTMMGGLLLDISSDEWQRSIDMTPDETLQMARYHLALGMSVPSVEGHFYRSNEHSNAGRYDEAIAEAEKIIELDGNDVRGLLALGRALNKAGRASDAIESLQMAMRLNPWGDKKGWIAYRLAESLYLAGRFDEAAHMFAESAAKNQNEWSYLMLAAALGQIGQVDEAGAALAKFDRIRAEAGEDPYTVAHVEGWAFKNPEDRATVQEGLRLAGMPVGMRTEAAITFPQNAAPTDVDGATTIDVSGARDLFEQGITMIDVRGWSEWVDGHVPGAVHLDLFHAFSVDAVSAHVGKDEQVIIFGGGAAEGSYAAIGTLRVVSWGYRNVYYLRDGFPGWKAAGYPTATFQEP
ncbi:MAG: BTAD domain-containing putative transcriptional regulator [Pseudomonadota bacterium]